MRPNSPISTDLLKAFEATCETATRQVRDAGSMGDAVSASNVTEPRDLQGIGRMLPGYRRIQTILGHRLDELLAMQLEAASRIREPYTLERELDHLKVHEWYVLRSSYPEPFAKDVTNATLLMRRIQGRRH
jgi:hypothetical protein